jgi:CRP/FNR family transcriptional regulator, cyclic AMP receptor protein
MLSEEDRRFLLSQAAVRRYRRGHPIFSKGDDATCLFFVLAGEIEIFIVNGCGRTVISRTEVGELFGGLELLSGQQRTASAVAIRDSLLGVIYQGGLERAMTARPELLTAIIRDLAATVAEITMRLSTLSLDAYGRLRFCLNCLARNAGDIAVVEGCWTHQQLAEFAGCSRETVSKIISELKRGQWITSDKKRITILRPLPEDF